MVSKQKKAPASLVKLPETTASIIERKATMMIRVVGLCLRANAVIPTIAENEATCDHRGGPANRSTSFAMAAQTSGT
jgi:hypothetical protein